MTVICPTDGEPCIDMLPDECYRQCSSLCDRMGLERFVQAAHPALALSSPEPTARHSDPPSSHAAVKSINRSSLKEHILLRLTANADRWYTDDDLVDLHHRGQRNIVARARQILETSGYIERSPDRMLPGDRITYKASDLAMAWRQASRL